MFLQNSYACGAPIRGDEYDKLIEAKISKTYESETTYSIKLPEKINLGDTETSRADVRILIYEKHWNDANIAIPLNLELKDNELVGEIKFWNEMDLTIEISVSWWSAPGLCPVVADKIIKHNRVAEGL